MNYKLSIQHFAFSICLCLLCFLLTAPSLLLAQTMACAGGPPAYCARQDWAPAPGNPTGNAPAGIAGLFGAGEITVMPTFGSRVVRLTDPNAYGNIDLHEAMTGFAGDSGGSAESEPISLDDDFFFVEDNGDAGRVLYSFDPVNLVAQRLYPLSYPSTNGLILTDGKTGIWSPIQDDVLYEWGVSGSDYQLWHWTFSSLAAPPASSTLDKDLTADSNCNQLASGAAWFSDLTVDAEANNFAFTNGAQQGSPTTAVVWRRSSNTCAWINISNGEYGGNLGSSGTISGLVTGNIHNLRMAPNGNWLRIDYDTGAAAAWEIGTSTYLYYSSSSRSVAGHLANGYSGFTASAGSGLGVSPFTPHMLGITSYTTGANNFLTVAVPPGGYDQHASWADDNPSDNMPLIVSGDGTGMNGDPWNDEIYAVSTNVSQQTWRFSRTWSLEESSYFNPAHAIAQASYDGKFEMLATDWGGEFGNTHTPVITSWSRLGNTVTVTTGTDICGGDSMFSGDTFTITGAAPGTGGTSINGTWTGTVATIAAPTSTPTPTTSTTGGAIPASYYVTVEIAYTTRALGIGCHTTAAPAEIIQVGSTTSTNSVSVPSPLSETNAVGYG
ncbi:MAG: hypothetical protein ACRD2B_17700, partial [Terriglobia bacterium]